MKPIPTEKEFKWQRLQTIMAAIQMYRNQCITVPSEWIAEKIILEKELGLIEERDVPVKVERAGRIEVTELVAVSCSDHGNWYKFHIAGNGKYFMAGILKEQVSEIKSAIERVLNNERMNLHESIKVLEQSEWLCIKRKEFNQQRDKAITDAFNAAREADPCAAMYKYKFTTLDSYLQSLNNK